MKPTVICLMISSLDGRLHPSRYTASPDGGHKAWNELFETVQDELNGDAWIVGRVTMAEMSKAGPHAPNGPVDVERPIHVAAKADGYAVVLDASGKLHFEGSTVGGNHVVAVLGRAVPDSHLAELAADGVSYIVDDGETFDLAAILTTLVARFGIKRLLLEGGAGINGSFFAAGLVDEFNVLLAPALDGGTDVQGIVAHDPGLRGTMSLSLVSVQTRQHGVVHLKYAVSPTAKE